jgi:two-component system, cell cycle sensor histidine kinase and response regulator CckA
MSIRETPVKPFHHPNQETSQYISASDAAKQKPKKTLSERITAEQDPEELTKIIGDYFAFAITPLALLDKEFSFIRVNEAYAKIWERDTSYFTGKNRFSLGSSNTRTIFEETVRTKKVYKAIEYPFVFADHPEKGETYWKWSLTPLFTKEGEVEFLLLSSEDATESKRAREALHLSQTRIRAVLEALPIGIWITDENGVIWHGNPAAREIWNGARYGGPEGYGEYSGWWAKTGKPIEPGGWALAPAVRKSETSLNEEVEIECLDGTRKTVLNSVTLSYDDRRQFVGAIAVNQDIIENVRLEKEFRQAQKIQAIGTLAGGIAHGFHNIMTGIIGFTEMELEDTTVENPVHRRLELVLKGAYRGRDLVKQILAFSRNSDSEKKPVSMSHILNDALPLIRASVPTTIEVRRNFLTKNDMIFADQTQMHQVMLNLCANAAYAMCDKGGTLEIILADENIGPDEPNHRLKPGPYVRLAINDTGHGMEPEVLDKIFDPFFTTKPTGEGTGLGLSMVHGIIKNHAGSIRVYSEPGIGTLFNIFIPKIESDSVDEVKHAEDVRGGKESILVVDDEDLLIVMNKQRLERLGYTVTVSTSSVEALEVFRREPHRFDLVITDYTMPHMTGLELAKEVLRIRTDLSIILCLGLNEPVPMEKIREAGIQDFLTKPVDKNEFANIVRCVLDRKR